MKENCAGSAKRENLIAPCGMDCALCVNYQAGRYDLKKKGMNRQYCPGCLPRGKGCLHMGDTCPKLLVGEVRFCFMCADFPCKRLRALDKRYRGKYHMSMMENLAFIREHGVHSFLEEQKAKWRCGRCGNEICCHNGLCLSCDLDVLLKNKKYRWGEE